MVKYGPRFIRCGVVLEEPDIVNRCGSEIFSVFKTNSRSIERNQIVMRSSCVESSHPVRNTFTFAKLGLGELRRPGMWAIGRHNRTLSL